MTAGQRAKSQMGQQFSMGHMGHGKEDDQFMLGPIRIINEMNVIGWLSSSLVPLLASLVVSKFESPVKVTRYRLHVAVNRRIHPSMFIADMT